MQLTVFSDLGLRVIMLLASDAGAGPTTGVAGNADSAAGGGARVTAAQVAESLNASRAHLSKVVTRLVELGAVEAAKGRGGGIALAPGARDLSVGGLLRQLEQGEVVDCTGTACPLLPACRLRGALAGAQEAFFAHLDSVRISDLVPASGITLLPQPMRHLG